MIEPLLNEIFAFAHAFQKPFAINDGRELEWNLRALITGVIRNSIAFNLDIQKRAEFIDKMQSQSTTAAGVVRQLQELLQWANSDLHAGRDAVELEVLENWVWENSVVELRSISEIRRQWNILPRYPLNQPTTPEGMFVFWHDRAVRNRRYRELRLQLWKRFPDHSERLNWLEDTLRNPPEYAACFLESIRTINKDFNASFEKDSNAQKEWKELYAEIRDEIWNDPHTTEGERGRLRYKELINMFLGLSQKGSSKNDVRRLLEGVHELFEQYGNAEGALSMTERIFQEAPLLGLNLDDLQAFIAPMLTAADEDIRRAAVGRRNLLNLRHAPLELKAPTMAGESFDIASLRGRVVLVDYWVTTCSGCISAMPRINEIYRKYRERGFEIVSVCGDGEARRSVVLGLERDLGLTWTTLAADRIWSSLMDYFGYNGVPQYMLLDRNGRLVAATGEIDMGRNLEAILKPLLAHLPDDLSIAQPMSSGPDSLQRD